MAELFASNCVLIVADPDRIAGLASGLAPAEVLASSGGDDTIDLFGARRPPVVVVTATLEAGDSKALIETLRGMVPRSEVEIVLIGDDEAGPVRTALDAADMGPVRFVMSPVVDNALRAAVAIGIAAVELVRGRAATMASPEPIQDAPRTGARTDQRARWEALADEFVGELDDEYPPSDEAEALPPLVVIRPRRVTDHPVDAEVAPVQAWRPGTTAEIHERDHNNRWGDPESPTREPTLIIRDPDPGEAPPPRAPSASSTPPPPPPPRSRNVSSTWPPVQPYRRSRTGSSTWPPSSSSSSSSSSDSEPSVTSSALPLPPPEHRALAEAWSGALPLAELDRASSSSTTTDEIELDDFDEEMVIGEEPAREVRLAILDDLPEREPSPATPVTASASLDGRDFARQLRAKMSMMAQRLFQGGDANTPQPAVDLGPRHDHHTEIDLTALGDEPALDRGVTEIEARAVLRHDVRDLTTSPGSWDTQIRERGLPDTGEIVRGLSDAAMLLAKMFAQSSTGRIGFRQVEPKSNGSGSATRIGFEKVVFFDQGRPVFASSSEPRDRMGELLVREGKITAAQYERCQVVAVESGRRMGEILVDFGYLKRRELLPAVRRHVEDLLYSLFSMDRGTYHIALDETPCAERIRLSRHPAALILEGIRRKLDRSSLDRLIGSPSTVIEVPDRERLGGIINLGDLAVEERGALAAFDGQADLSTVARIAGVDVADVLPLAWGLCVLGLATARRTDTEVPDESSALVGETDLAIDRERVRARWQLVGEADYFALLGVRRDATAFEIRRAYQSARRDFAADGFPTDLRRELAQELDDISHVLDEAFRVLRDDRLRLTYLTNLID
ncbi:MAG: hypothetical protein H0T42_26730 [Deltaproteobacteria bacterium]|nr:hypothetical protein [Deltaproteobacteria bacterium]